MRREQRLLMHHGDADGGGLEPEVESTGLRPSQSISPPSRSIHAGDDFHQRGFAGAIFAHEQVDLAGVDFQVAVAQSSDAAEALLNVGEGHQHGGKDSVYTAGEQLRRLRVHTDAGRRRKRAALPHRIFSSGSAHDAEIEGRRSVEAVEPEPDRKDLFHGAGHR